MKNATVETRIELTYNCSVIDFFQQCIDEHMDTHEIAMMIGCSVSNLRRIARKYQFTFYHPNPTPMLSHSKEFHKSVNVTNFLSKSWGNLTSNLAQAS
ncbi:MAG: hypothetical protein ACO2ZM_09365 [Francisellaceae bacterium]